jgi:uncharacterized protein (DUF488 family)
MLGSVADRSTIKSSFGLIVRGSRQKALWSMPSASQHQADSALKVWTVGHSTRTASEFSDVLTVHGIELVIDVRRFPGSRRLPHFAAATLEQDLAKAGILYHGIPALGGRRRPLPGSVNDAWRHPAFRGYADYVSTEPFAEGLIELLMLAGGARTAIMCAELLWWRCHRRLIADVLVSLHIDVLHIRDENVAEPHRLAPPGRLERGILTYASPRV